MKRMIVLGLLAAGALTNAVAYDPTGYCRLPNGGGFALTTQSRCFEIGGCWLGDENGGGGNACDW